MIYRDGINLWGFYDCGHWFRAKIEIPSTISRCRLHFFTLLSLRLIRCLSLFFPRGNYAVQGRLERLALFMFSKHRLWQRSAMSHFCTFLTQFYSKGFNKLQYFFSLHQDWCLHKKLPQKKLCLVVAVPVIVHIWLSMMAFSFQS